jgi:two-component system, NarL family, response regulator DegU
VTGNDSGTARPIRVLLADDHSLFRKGLRHMLDIEEDVEVVGEARDGEEVQRLARELQPDVVLLDINMPVVDGIAAARELRQVAPELGILMLTMFAEDEFLSRALEAGANGYLLKDIPFDQVVSAVRAAARGETVGRPRVNLRAPSV